MTENKKTPQDVLDQGESLVLDVQISIEHEQVIKSLAKILSCEIDIEKAI
ncbi:hypothetical protein [Turicibacter sanguinis]|nr:hypothetical protein [Turicibacter sanguinis]MDB8553779.1 hypothetical protein [Turicibacter sanguinis]